MGHARTALVYVLVLLCKHTQLDTSSSRIACIEYGVRRTFEGRLYVLQDLSHTLRHLPMSHCAEASVT